MKKIFGTSIFWILVLVLFWVYLRLFDNNTAQQVAHFFVSKTTNITGGAQTGTDLKSTINNNFTTIDTQIDLVTEKIKDIKTQTTQAQTALSTATQTPTMVRLYYFNQTEDKKLPIAQQASPASLLSVFRTLPKTDNIIRDTITLLLQGGLTDTEVKEGFTSDFVTSIRLSDTQLMSDGTLNLAFMPAPGTSIGGSAYIGILTSAITQTALQFPQVKTVNLLPVELFQP